MSKPVFRSYGAVQEVDKSTREIVAVINTDAVDRYRTVIVPTGGKFGDYRKNPVVLLNHDVQDVIGKNLWIRADGKKKLVAKTKFKPEGKSEAADRAFDDYESGFLSGWSISFDPTAMDKPTPDEIRARPDLARCYMIYREWELLEYSAVTIPGNPQALTESVERGLVLPEWLDKRETTSSKTVVTIPAAIEPPTTIEPPALPPLVGRSLEQVRAAIRRQVAEQFAAKREMHLRDIQDLARGQV